MSQERIVGNTKQMEYYVLYTLFLIKDGKEMQYKPYLEQIF